MPVEALPTRTRYHPRTEGLFARIRRHHDPARRDDYWEVASTDGLVSTYGTPGAAGEDPAVVSDPANRVKVFAWKLTQTRDSFRNLIEYEYLRDPYPPEPQRGWDQLYLKQVRYIDYTYRDQTKFLVSIDFEYDRDDRPDPFSDFRAGFEIRTRKRCKRFVVHTHADEVVRTDDVVRDRPKEAPRIREYELTYLDERVARGELSEEMLPPNSVSLLSRIRVIGYDESRDRPEQRTQELPPLEFDYTRFEPERRRFAAVKGEIPARSLASPDLELVDLFGKGLPDILEMNGSVRYWRNLGGGRFDLPRPMRDAPTGLQLADPGVQLVDADGDGGVDLLVTTPPLSGYFPLRFGGEWDRGSFRRFEVAPSFNVEDPEVKLVDLDGDGRTDVLRSGSSFECFFNRPDKERSDKWGWNETRRVERRTGEAFPNVNFSDPRVKWGDMSGDGLQDIALVHDGNVEYWPNLGHGNWGPRVSMRNGPRYPYGYDPKRILVGDVDGDGLADIVYVDDRRVTLWLNQGGRRWSDPITVQGTPAVSDMDAVRLVDLLGAGVGGLLWSADANGRAREHMFFLDFTGGTKPYLLNEIDNHMGARTRVTYATSTRFYLADQEPHATPWRTPLPFPVQVVAKVEVEDSFSGGRLTTEYRYHDGYWDGAEREFRGFGMVEQQDSEIFEDFSLTHLMALVERVHFSPPLLTRTWFHQGPIGDEHGDWEEANPSAEFWPGDSQILPRPQAVTDFLMNLPRRARRDALRALRGSVLRTELYALDGSGRETRPYTVAETAYGVCEVVPEGEGHQLACKPADVFHPEDPYASPRIFFPHVLAQRTTQWERGDDPLTSFTFTNDYDEYGQPRQKTVVAPPRRSIMRRKVVGVSAPAPGTEVDETKILATHTRTAYAIPDGDNYIRDRVASVLSFELAQDFAWAESRPDDILQVLSDQATAAQGIRRLIRDRLEPWTPVQPVPDELRLVGDTRNYYDGEAFQGRPAGTLGPYGTLTRSESLAFTDAELDNAYGERRPRYLDGAADLPAGAPADFGADLGYRSEQVPPGQGPRRYYVDTQRRRFDFQEEDSAQKRGLVTATQDPLGHQTTITPDKYWLLPVRVADAAKLETQATYDYRVLQPRKVIDPNHNQTAYAFTPLGLLASIAVMGKDGENKGDDRQALGTRFVYDLLAFEALRQPASVRTIRRVHHVYDSDVPLPERDETIETIEFSDGFGRLLQTRAQGEDLLLGDPIFGGAVLPADQSDLEGTLRPVVGRRRGENNPPVEAARLPDVVAMAAAGDKLFAATRDDRLWARDRDPPGSTWHHIGHAKDVLAMAAAGGKLFAVTADDRLLARDPVLHDTEWQDIGDADRVVLLASTNGHLFGARPDGWVRARPAQPGHADWQGAPHHLVNPVALTAIDGMLYTANSDNQLWVRAATLENPASSYLVGDGGGAIALASANNQLYAVDRDGKLWVRGTVTEPVGWQGSGEHSAGGATTLAATNGRLFAATRDGRLRVRRGVWEWADWESIGDADGAVTLAADGNRLFAKAADGELRVRPATAEPVAWGDWTKIGRADGAVLLAAAAGHLFATTTDGQLRVRPATEEVVLWDDWTKIGDDRGAVLLAAAAGHLFGATTKTLGTGDSRLFRVRPAVPPWVDWQDISYEIVEKSSVLDAVAITALGSTLYLVDSQDRLWLRARPDVWEPIVGETVRYHHHVVVSGWQVYDNKGRVIEKYEPFFSLGRDYRSPAMERDAYGREVLGQKASLYYDPRGQLIRTVNPDGSEQRVIFGRPEHPGDFEGLKRPGAFLPTPWETYTYDANDLAPLSFHPTEKLPDGSPKPLTERAPAAHHFTPTSAVIDVLGWVICQIERNGATPGEHWFITRSSYDVDGNLLSVRDAYGRPAFQHAYDLLNRRLRVESIDAGLRTSVMDAAGNLVESRDSRRNIALREYDSLNRVKAVWALEGDKPGARLTMREKLEYGDGGNPDQPEREREAQRKVNRLARIWRHHDEAGLLEVNLYDFKGNVAEKTRRVVSDGALGRHEGWTAAWSESRAESALDGTLYRTTARFDALNRPVEVLCPEDVGQKRAKLEPSYNRAGALEKIDLDDQPYVAQIAYNAKGQRVLIAYGKGNGTGVMTRYAYDPQTFRLVRLRSERYRHPPSTSDTWQGEDPAIQDFAYGYDLVGNITWTDERTQNCGIIDSAEGRDRLSRAFEYDPLYRLTKATGRACKDIAGPRPSEDLPRCGFYRAGTSGVPSQASAPNDTERYAETYLYDAVGNLEELRYLAGRQWTRKLTVEEGSNRGKSVTQGSGPSGVSQSFDYDANGNLREKNTGRHHIWDHADRLIAFRIQPSDTSPPSLEARYLYGADGMRVKKWVRNGAGKVESTLYIDRAFEHHSWTESGVPNQNNRVHVMDGRQRIAIARRGPARADDAGPAVQYHLSDHLGSSHVVLGNTGAWINREEYFPYGDTSFGSFARKRFRFTGNERDEETGLYYHGARYYAPSWARWVTCDPLEMADGPNLYVYAGNSPFNFVDESGQYKVTPVLLRGPVPGPPIQVAVGMLVTSSIFLGTVLYKLHQANKDLAASAATLARTKERLDQYMELAWKNDQITLEEYQIYQRTGNLPPRDFSESSTKSSKSGPRAREDTVKSDWFKNILEGQQFNKLLSFNYVYRELYIKQPGKGSSYYRLDAYDPGKEIISRKFTQFSEISLETGISYVHEIPTKYSRGSEIANVLSSGLQTGAMPVDDPFSSESSLAGQRLEGQYILEVPMQNKPVPQRILEDAKMHGVIIRDVYGNIY